MPNSILYCRPCTLARAKESYDTIKELFEPEMACISATQNSSIDIVYNGMKLTLWVRKYHVKFVVLYNLLYIYTSHITCLHQFEKKETTMTSSPLPSVMVSIIMN